jgi:hypothetical protein
LREFFKKRYTARTFAQLAQKFSEEHFPNAVFEDYGDIAGNHSESTSGMSPIDVVNEELNIKIQYQQIPLKESLEFVSEKLSQNIKGDMAIRVHPSMRITIEALNGGYTWQKNRDGSIKQGIPAADETFEHLMDVFRMGLWTKFAFRRAERKLPASLKRVESIWDDTSW